MSDNIENGAHSHAAGAYDNNAQNTGNQRELEARILLKSNRMLQELASSWDSRPGDLLEETLKYNRNIWMLFYDTAMESKENGHTDALRTNIINLANFIFKREMDILANPDKNKLTILVSINSEIAAGLTESKAG